MQHFIFQSSPCRSFLVPFLPCESAFFFVLDGIIWMMSLTQVLRLTLHLAYHSLGARRFYIWAAGAGPPVVSLPSAVSGKPGAEAHRGLASMILSSLGFAKSGQRSALEGPTLDEAPLATALLPTLSGRCVEPFILNGNF